MCVGERENWKEIERYTEREREPAKRTCPLPFADAHNHYNNDMWANSMNGNF